MRRKLLYMSVSMIFGIIIAHMNSTIATVALAAVVLFVLVLTEVVIREKSGRGRSYIKIKYSACVNTHKIDSNGFGVAIKKPEWDKHERGTADGSNKVNQIFVYIGIMLFFIIGASRYMFQQSIIDKEANLDRDEKTLVTGRIVECAEESERMIFVIRLLKVGAKAGRFGKARVTMYTGKNVRNNGKYLPGHIVKLTCVLEKPEGATNPKCFDYRTYLKSKGIYHTARTQKVEIIGESLSLRDMLLRVVMKVKIGFKDIKDGNNERASELLIGMVFGDTDAMDEDETEKFRENGIAHILAVSGFHIGILYGFYRWLKKRIKSRLVIGAAFSMIFFYATLAMWSVTVIRAVLMVIITEVGDKCERRYDMLTALGLVSVISLLYDPMMLLGVSFAMSYIAVLTIAIVVPALERKLKGVLAVPIGVQLGLFPYSAYVFNHIAPGSILFNIPVLFIMPYSVALAIPAAVIMALPGDELLSLADLLVKIALVPAQVIVLMNDIFTKIPGMSYDVISPRLWMVVLFYSVLFTLCSESFIIALLRKSKDHIWKEVMIAIIIVIISVPYSYDSFDKADIIMVDVGQGDSMYFRGDDKVNVMIDGGGSDNRNVGKKVLKPFLLKNGKKDLTVALATHLHADHFKGLKELVSSYPVDNMIIKGKKGDVIRAGNIKIEILWPKERDPETDDENENSLIFRVDQKGVSTLVTGDISEEGEHALIEEYKGTGKLDVDVLKVAHHGSRYSSSSEFLDEVSPVIALIGVGKNNTYGHPTREALDRIKESGAKIYRTDENGAIGLIINDGLIKVCSMKS